jgi:hypothetical protein
MRSVLCNSLCAFALVTALFAGPALAADPAPAAAAPAAPKPTPSTINGTLVSLAGDTLVVKDDKGATVSMTLAADARLLQVKKIDISAIQPSSFVATANRNQPDGTGVSTELRVFGPSLRGMGEGSYPMDDGQNMTNGTVKTVVASPKGRELDVSYNGKGGPGVRHITVPADMVIRSMDKIERTDLTAGIAVQVRAVSVAGGPLTARAVIIGDHGQPPAL